MARGDLESELGVAGARPPLRFRADFINAFNCVNFQNPNTGISSSSFGTISSACPPRNIQLGVKLQF